jgi:predicted transcriptional regulator
LTTNLAELTADIVSSYVGQNHVSADALPALIRTVYDGLANLGGAAVVAPTALIPAVPIKKSITPEFLISLEDGRKYKSLKRHLRTAYNLSPEDYRAKWGLPKDYPMVAPAYAASRSALAKAAGLGQIARKKPAPAPVNSRKPRTPKAAAE